VLGANAVGGAVVFLLLTFILPAGVRYAASNVAALVGYMLASAAAGWTVSRRLFAPIREWASGARPVADADRRYIARHPLRQSIVNFALWVGSLAVFVPLNATYGAATAVDVGFTILLGGITTCGLSYLVAERLLRPLNALAFADRVPRDRLALGVKARLLLAWGLGTGIPLLGIVLLAVDRPGRSLSLAGLVFLAGTGFLSGAWAMLLAARSVADPIESVTRALAAVERDRLDVEVPVYDASQVGRLQAGFNAMVEGLRERRLLRDLFGRQVGEDVARHAVERGVRLGGERVDVAVLFVDVIGSTPFAAARPPEDVVRALNRFFGAVVQVVGDAGGFVNKFEGDAALCIFGAPVPRDDAATCALVAARRLCERLQGDDELAAAIGVSAGEVVAGNVGTPERFEYTVIGDPVNEAARLTELAKAHPRRVLASCAALDRAEPQERARWAEEPPVVLRGRDDPTRLATLR
jgi:adenylate cyclase